MASHADLGFDARPLAVTRLTARATSAILHEDKVKTKAF
jgi:hypothetical protein